MIPIMYRQTELRGHGREEFGEFNLERFKVLINELPIFKELEQSVGLQASEHDWIDISFNGNSDYMLYTLRLHDNRPLWQRLLSGKEIILNLQGLPAVLEIINIYVSKDRKEFENEYS